MLDTLMSFGLWLEKTPLSAAVLDWALFSDIIWVGHWFGFFFLVGTSVAIDLRLLGVAGKDQAAAEFIEQFLPWTWIGLGLAAVSGFLYFAPSATTFFRSSFFFLKVFLTFLGAGSVLLIQLKIRQWERAAGLAPAAKITAIISLLLWIGTILAGTHVPVQTCF